MRLPDFLPWLSETAACGSTITNFIMQPGQELPENVLHPGRQCRQPRYQISCNDWSLFFIDQDRMQRELANPSSTESDEPEQELDQRDARMPASGSGA